MKLSTVLKTQEITLETSEGEVKVFASQMSFADEQRRMELLKPLIDDEGQFVEGTKLIQVNATTVMSGVKNEDGDYYFNQDSVDTFLVEVSGMPSALIHDLSKVVNELNPMPEIEETLDSKKKSS